MHLSTGSFYTRHDSLCYTSCGALAGMRNSLIGILRGIDSVIHCTLSRHSTTELHPANAPTFNNTAELFFVPQLVNKEGYVLLYDALNTLYLRLYDG